MRATGLSAAVLLLTLPALVACGGAHWSKTGASKDAISADLADCRAQGQALVQRDADIESDIMATRAQDWQRTGTLAPNQAGMAGADRKRAQNYVDDCMRAKGYAPAS
jgi:hypothetical protein